jgi:hypothetical protein
MSKSGSISVIIPTYNRANFLRDALNSILCQTRKIDEIVVVNDGSTDNTLEVLSSYREVVTVLSQENRGKTAALNAGLRCATSEYVWFCDDDDVATPDGIAPLAAALDANENLTMAYGMHLKFHDGHRDQLFPREFWALPEPDSAIINFLGNLFPFQGAMLVRRAVFERIGGFNTDFERSEDVEALIRLALDGESVYVPHVVFHQRGHNGCRGRPGQTMSSKAALSRAVEFDQKAILLHRDDLSIASLTPKYAQMWAPQLQRRAGILQRALIFARFALWKEAVADLKAAVEYSPTDALPAEQAAAAVAVVKAQMWDLLAADRASIRGLKEIRRTSPFGRTIATALVHPLPWHIRIGLGSGNYLLVWSRVCLLAKILGMAGVADLLLHKLRTAAQKRKVTADYVKPDGRHPAGRAN